MTKIAQSIARKLTELADFVDPALPKSRDVADEPHSGPERVPSAEFEREPGATGPRETSWATLASDGGTSRFTTPDGYVTELRQRTNFEQSAGGRRIAGLIERDEPCIRRNLEIVEKLGSWIGQIAHESEDPTLPQWLNDHLPAYDAIAIAAMLASERPSVFLEIGSGNSTKFARSAIAHLGLPTRIVSIDPCPRAEIDEICDEIVRKPLEDACAEVLRILPERPLVYFDGSHRILPNSDVCVFFTELLPAFPDGLVYGIHDIHLPSDYSPEFVRRVYSEQYMLAAFLLGGADEDSIELPVAHLTKTGDFRAHMPADHHSPTPHGESFWLKRRGRRLPQDASGV